MIQSPKSCGAKAVSVLCVALCVSALRAADEQKQASVPGLVERSPRYRIHPSDVVEIQYRYTPEFNFSATVQPDGYITSSMTGDVHVGGLTVEEAEAAVTQKASARLNDPVVAVVLREFVKPRFIVAGEVTHPGTFEIRGEMSLIQAIAMSGGFTHDTAKRTQVVLVRKVNTSTAHVRVFDMKKLMSAGGVMEDVQIQPDDLIVVPRNFISKIQPFIPIGSLALYGLTWGLN